MYIILYCNTTQ